MIGYTDLCCKGDAKDSRWRGGELQCDRTIACITNEREKMKGILYERGKDTEREGGMEGRGGGVEGRGEREGEKKEERE